MRETNPLLALFGGIVGIIAACVIGFLLLVFLIGVLFAAVTTDYSPIWTAYVGYLYYGFSSTIAFFVYAAMSLFALIRMLYLQRCPRLFNGSVICIVLLALACLFSDGNGIITLWSEATQWAGKLYLPTVIALLTCYLCVSWGADEENTLMMDKLFLAAGKENNWERVHYDIINTNTWTKVGKTSQQEFTGAGIGLMLLIGFISFLFIPIVVCFKFVAGQLLPYLLAKEAFVRWATRVAEMLWYLGVKIAHYKTPIIFILAAGVALWMSTIALVSGLVYAGLFLLMAYSLVARGCLSIFFLLIFLLSVFFTCINMQVAFSARFLNLLNMMICLTPLMLTCLLFDDKPSSSGDSENPTTDPPSTEPQSDDCKTLQAGSEGESRSDRMNE